MLEFPEVKADVPKKTDGALGRSSGSPLLTGCALRDPPAPPGRSRAACGDRAPGPPRRDAESERGKEKERREGRLRGGRGLAPPPEMAPLPPPRLPVGARPLIAAGSGRLAAGDVAQW